MSALAGMIMVVVAQFGVDLRSMGWRFGVPSAPCDFSTSAQLAFGESVPQSFGGVRQFSQALMRAVLRPLSGYVFCVCLCSLHCMGAITGPRF